MINKLKYSAPVTETVVVNMNDRILSGSDWYLQGGQGDFNYSVEEDDSWA